MKIKTPFQSNIIKAIFNNYPNPIRDKLLFIRELIFETAIELPTIGPIEETLKWEEPSYCPSQTKSGSSVRIHHHASKPFDYGIYFICSTTLVATFRELYPTSFKFNGNRCLEFMIEDTLPIEHLKHCIQLTFSYYLSKK